MSTLSTTWYRDGNQAAVDQFAEHIPGAHAGELIGVAHENNTGPILDAGEKLISQPHIHHRKLIHNDQVCRQRLLLSAAVGVIFFTAEAQAAVERPRLVKASASAIRRLARPVGAIRTIHLSGAGGDKLPNGLEHRCLAGAGRTGDNGQAVAVSRVDRCLLFGRQRQPHFTLDLLQRLLNALRRRRLYQPHGNTPGRFIFLCECAGQVDVIFDGYATSP